MRFVSGLLGLLEFLTEDVLGPGLHRHIGRFSSGVDGGERVVCGGEEAAF